MRLTALFIVLLSLFGLTYLYGLPYAAEKLTIKFLHQTNFQDIKIEGLSASFSGIHVKRIQFDKDGFNLIEDMDLAVNWTRQKVIAARIAEIKSAHIASAPHQIIDLASEVLEKIPSAPLLVEHFISDIATDHGDIRLEGSLNLNSPDENEEQKATMRVHASQYQVSFDAVLDGVITENRLKELTATIEEGRVNLGPFQLSRGSGWISYDETQSPMTLAGQIDIGSGRFHGLALNRVSLIIAGTRLAPEFLFRSGLSGQPDFNFSLDYSGGAKKVFQATMKTGTITPVLETLEATKEVPQALADLKNIDLSLNYAPDRRFAGGPYPFELLLKEGEKETLQGTALFYPDTLDLRGSAQSSEALAKALVDYFGLDPAGQTGEFLRLDTSLKSWFKAKKK